MNGVLVDKKFFMQSTARVDFEGINFCFIMYAVTCVVRAINYWMSD